MQHPYPTKLRGRGQREPAKWELKGPVPTLPAHEAVCPLAWGSRLLFDSLSLTFHPSS